MGTFLVFLIALALDFLVTAGLVWLGCWALGLIGIVVVWSWTVSFAIWILVEIIRAIF